MSSRIYLYDTILEEVASYLWNDNINFNNRIRHRIKHNRLIDLDILCPGIRKGKKDIRIVLDNPDMLDFLSNLNIVHKYKNKIAIQACKNSNLELLDNMIKNELDDLVDVISELYNNGNKDLLSRFIQENNSTYNLIIAQVLAENGNLIDLKDFIKDKDIKLDDLMNYAIKGNQENVIDWLLESGVVNYDLMIKLARYYKHDTLIQKFTLLHNEKRKKMKYYSLLMVVYVFLTFVLIPIVFITLKILNRI